MMKTMMTTMIDYGANDDDANDDDDNDDDDNEDVDDDDANDDYEDNRAGCTSPPTPRAFISFYN